MEHLPGLQRLIASLNELPFVIRIALCLSAVSVILLVSTSIFTSARYASSLQQFTSAKTNKAASPETPPKVPYTIPFLGNAIQFLSAKRPGDYWNKLMRTHPRDVGACTLLMGGDTAHMIFDPVAVETLFKNRSLHRDQFNDKMIKAGLGVSSAEHVRFLGLNEREKRDEKGRNPRERHDSFNFDFLLNPSAACELARRFVIQLQKRYDQDSTIQSSSAAELNLGKWLRDHMFKASAESIFGIHLLEIYPELMDDFWAYDKTMLNLFFEVPKFLDAQPYKDLATATAGFSKWRAQMLNLCSGEIADPKTTEWEPIFGSRVNRSRQLFYREQGISNQTAASVDLGFMFGLESNSIPCMVWMFMHLLDPNGDTTLLPTIRAEIETARLPDGKGFDTNKITGLTVLQSVFSEVLRLYSDLLVTRNLESDLILPFEGGKRQMRFAKGTNIMAPSWLGHHDESVWPKSYEFDNSRFLRTDPETGKQIFTASSLTGKYFPWGGGKTICPGRVFAKQEVLIAVAMALDDFDFDFVRFVDEKGDATNKFPGIRPAFSGTGIVAMEGGMVAKIRRKTK